MHNSPSIPKASKTPNDLDRSNWTISLIVGILLLPPLQSVRADGLTQLKKNDREVIETIQAAKTCMPKIEIDQVHLCTGVDFDRETILRIKTMDKPNCFKEIEKHGYRVLPSFSPGVLSPTSWAEFENSTKRAETLQKEKAVLFRSTATTVDCIHELTHVLQYRGKIADVLNPIVRDKRFSAFQADVEKAVDEIESHEKKGDKAFAEKNAQLIQDHLNNLKDFWNLHQTLDEKDAHLLVLFGCRNWWTCTQDDLETAAANLIRLKDILSSAAQEEVSAIAKASLLKKEAEAFSKMESAWKPLSQKNKTLLLRLVPLSPQEMIKTMKKNGADLTFDERIHELALLRNTTPLSPCQIEVPSGDPQMSFEAAVLFIQMENNLELCDSLTLTSETEQQFKHGKLSKEDFESKVLGWRANRLLSENEQVTFILDNFPILKAERRKKYQDKIASLKEKMTQLREAMANKKRASR